MAKSPKPDDAVVFIPAVTFFGYPDEIHRVDYLQGVPSSAPAAYVAMLRENGLVAEPGTPETTTEAVAPI